MTGGGWPSLDTILAGAALRAPSVISTIYGDAILPRGGSLALADLLTLMRRLGATEGMVRTAVSRLARDGVLRGSRAGRHSAYALTAAARAEFAAVVPRIYRPGSTDWDGRLHLVFPEAGADRTELETAGFAVLAPGVLAGVSEPPAGMAHVVAVADEDTLRTLSLRAWPLAQIAGLHSGFLNTFERLDGKAPAPLDAMAARILLIHAFRRIALRQPQLPARLLPRDWPGHTARTLCEARYAALAPLAEEWLDAANSGSGPLPQGPDPVARFSSGGRSPSATAW